MEKTGIVIETTGEYMLVSVHRDSACGENCAACGLCKNNREMTLRLKNTDNFKIGEAVRLTSDDKKFLHHSAAGYLSLTALLIAGGIIGGFLGGDWAAFLGAFFGLLIGIMLLKLFFKDKLEITAEKA
ncbi:MAG: SoxR reducing system RseC family protein [Clostridia bacterium]|nr:SoxR reducing system RseC family protein [Clostridia bacterium]